MVAPIDLKIKVPPRPRLGVRPEWCWRLDRVEEIHAGIVRWINGKKKPKEEWFTEIEQHLDWLQEHKPQFLKEYLGMQCCIELCRSAAEKLS